MAINILKCLDLPTRINVNENVTKMFRQNWPFTATSRCLFNEENTVISRYKGHNTFLYFSDRPLPVYNFFLKSLFLRFWPMKNKINRNKKCLMNCYSLTIHIIIITITITNKYWWSSWNIFFFFNLLKNRHHFGSLKVYRIYTNILSKLFTDNLYSVEFFTLWHFFK